MFLLLLSLVNLTSVLLRTRQVVTHSATFDFWPERRHALRATPHGERPLSVADYEKKFGKEAKDRQKEIYRKLGVDVDNLAAKDSGKSITKGYND